MHKDRVMQLATILRKAHFMAWIDQWKPVHIKWPQFIITMLSEKFIKIVASDRCAQSAGRACWP